MRQEAAHVDVVELSEQLNHVGRLLRRRRQRLHVPWRVVSACAAAVAEKQIALLRVKAAGEISATAAAAYYYNGWLMHGRRIEQVGGVDGEGRRGRVNAAR